MSRRTSKFRFWKKLRSGRKQSEGLGVQLENVSERYFFRRLDRLTAVRRFVITWLLLIGLLCGLLVGQIRALNGYFQTLQPVPGGIYSEGILGNFTNANPLYASSPVDESVSRLLFAGLFRYDDNNRLVGDLAEGYSVDASSKIYTVKLKPNLTWHDGAPLTAKDVAFTYRMIQNPDALSSLNKGWQGIKVTAVDAATVSFELPNVLGSFPYNMTNGIIPEHLLKDVSPGEMRSHGFNTTSPVGAGPFVWQTVEVTGNTPETRQAQIALAPFGGYNGGAPKVSSFILHTFHDAGQLEASFKRRELTAAGFSDLPAGLAAQKGTVTSSFILSAANMVFFKQATPALSDGNVRRGLAQAVNVPAIIDSLGYSTKPVKGPFLLGQLGYDKGMVQPSFDAAAAAASLDAAGWKLGSDGVRAKDGKQLRLSLYGEDKAEARMVSEQIAQAWKSVGVLTDVRLQNSEDLQRSIANREYDALLYGISIGVDPDVFVYWHSSQNDLRSTYLNFSGYKSKQADTALEAGRTRIEPALRVIKYRPFLQAWQQDIPAIGLYQPRYVYLTHGTVHGLRPHTLNTAADRFTSVHTWQIRQAEVTNQRK